MVVESGEIGFIGKVEEEEEKVLVFSHVNGFDADWRNWVVLIVLGGERFMGFLEGEIKIELMEMREDIRICGSNPNVNPLLDSSFSQIHTIKE